MDPDSIVISGFRIRFLRPSESEEYGSALKKIRIRYADCFDTKTFVFKQIFFPVRNEVGTGSAFGSGSAFLGDARTILKLYFLSLNTQFAGTRIS